MDQKERVMDHRSVAGFSKLNFKAVGKVNLVQNDSEGLTIEAKPEILSRIRTEVINGILIITCTADWLDWLGAPFYTPDDIIFNINMRRVEEISFSGIGKFNSPKIISESLRLALSGPGSVTITEVLVRKLTVELSGVGSIQISGKTVNQSVHLSGAGSYKGENLESLNTAIHLSGVGNASLWVNETLDANISGAGVVEYKGIPQVTKRISGIGMLKCL